MFNLFKKKEAKQAQPQPQSPILLSLRDTMMGDLSPAQWPSGNVEGHPWSMFVEARDQVMVKQDTQEAIRILHKIAATPGLESRHYLQAWHFLHRLGVNPPPEEARKVYGVVIDVHLKQGLELIAAYADHTARYINYTGGGAIWEAPDTSLNAQIDALLQACSVAAAQIPPLDNIHPNPPKDVDAVQICILTPSGIHHGYGTWDSWAKNELGGPIVTAATGLMKSLVERSNARK
jgi:hypothetical protein